MKGGSNIVIVSSGEKVVKSTVILRIIEELIKKKLMVGGIVEDVEKKMETFDSKSISFLKEIKNCKNEDYNMFIDNIKEGIDFCDVVIIDGITSLELGNKEVIEVIKKLFLSRKTALISMEKKLKYKFFNLLEKKENIVTFEITGLNRNLLPYKIIKFLE